MNGLEHIVDHKRAALLTEGFDGQGVDSFHLYKELKTRHFQDCLRVLSRGHQVHGNHRYIRNKIISAQG